MSEPILARIVRQSGVPRLLDILAADLAPTDLQSLLLAVFRRRAAAQAPARVLAQYAASPFVQPAAVDPRLLHRLDGLAFAAAPDFTPLEIAPLAPLGTCAALAPVDQNRVVSTVRNTEVVADATNVLALEAALRRRAARQAGAPEGARVRLCASTRLVRAQRYTGPHMRAHFRMFSLCTAGRTRAPGDFEPAACAAHLAVHLRLLAAARAGGFGIAGVRVALIPLADGIAVALEQEVFPGLAAAFPDVALGLQDATPADAAYYRWARFGVYATDAAGTEYMVADGGATDWTQQLLSDRRERLWTSGVALERLAALFAPPQGAGLTFS